MKEKQSCPLCKTECEIYSIGPLQQIFTIDCPLCGKYNLTDRAKEHLASLEDSFYIISGVTRNFYELHKDMGGFFVIKWEMIRDNTKFQAEFVSKMPKSVLDKAALLMQYIARKSNYPGHMVEISLSQDYPICFSKNADELRFYIGHLMGIGAIKANITMDGTGSLSLTAKGWQTVENLNEPNIKSKQAFVAMWFDESLKEIFTKGIEPLEKDTGFKMFRIDQEPFNEKICDRIIAEIKKSRFLIADCTELRQAVFFEAGYAMGLGLPVIFTCKKGTKIEGCFDTRQYNHILWENAEDLRVQLKDRILAVIGKVQN